MTNELARTRRRKRRASRAALPASFVAILSALSLGLALLGACGEEARPRVVEAPPQVEPAAFAGSARCAACHPREHAAWVPSDHARAMQLATPEHVRGDFANASARFAGVTTSFEQRDGKYFVRTDDPEGNLREFEVAHVFGCDPLQQVLVPFPRGIEQALGVAWDTRPKERGGQRWFHLYPDAPPPPGDPLHWTGREQRWNHQCAECHSTNLEKRYDIARDAYDTRWSEISVGCEACHGAASRHIAWAEQSTEARAADPLRGFVRSLRAPEGAWIVRDEVRGIAQWEGAPRGTQELENCARCHARRGPLVEHSLPEAPFLDAYRPSLLEERLYHADGQILDEVFEWGSFAQSKMLHAGVRCSDCHEPHGGKPRAPGNALCSTCHLPARFDTQDHHHHAPGTPGASCVECHMPMRTYMVIDGRRDHSFRVPRPDLSLELGTPNACASCHEARGAKWAHDAIRAWRKTPREETPHFARALDAGRRGTLDAEERLLALQADAKEPAIARATAWSLLPPLASARALEALPIALGDAEPLVRIAALHALEELPLAEPPAAAIAALADPLRGVRVATARALAGFDRSGFSAEQHALFETALREAREAELALAERPQSWINLSNLELRLGRLDEAARCLEHALELEPRFVPALVNSADVARLRGDDRVARATLERALAIEPGSPDVVHALGLLYLRTGDRAAGLRELARAHELAPANVRYAYVHAVALHDAGDIDGAFRVLDHAHRTRPADRDVLAALSEYEEQRGRRTEALRWAEILQRLVPADTAIAARVEALRR